MDSTVVVTLRLFLWLLWIVTVTLFTTHVPPGVDGCACESSSRGPLMDFYVATNGPWWFRRWDTTLDVCSWQGVTCTSDGRLTNISLTKNNLSGTLPSSLGDLADVAYFSVDENNITGTLPTSLQSWTNMYNFDVSYNQLNGTLPPEYGSWTVPGLSFWVSFNRLSGTLPPQYREMNLCLMGLENNRFSGTLPSVYSQWRGNAISMKFGSNKFNGTLPAEYADWVAVKGIDFSFNQLSGTLPKVYQSWSRLEFLRLQSNELSGTLPSEYGDAWVSVRIINLFLNAFNGTLPVSWSRMGNLQLFTLAGNRLSGTLPWEFSNLTNLSMLSLEVNLFSGYLPASWGSLRLQMLGLQGNAELIGGAPATWGSIFSSPINVLSVCDTKLCGINPSSLGLAYLNCFPEAVLYTEDLITILANVHPFELPSTCRSTAAPPRNNSSVAPRAASSTLASTTSKRAYEAAVVTSTAVFATVAAGGLLTVGGTSLVSGLGVSTRMGGVQASTALIRLQRRCASGITTTSPTASGDDDDSQPAVGGDPMDNPTTLELIELGSSEPARVDIAYAGGTVVGNVAFVAGFTILRLMLYQLAASLKEHLKEGGPMEGNAPPRGGDDTSVQSSSCSRRQLYAIVTACIGEDRFPGAMVAPYVLLLQPSITAAIVLAARGVGVGVIALGVGMLLLWLIPMAGLGWAAWIRFHTRWTCIATRRRSGNHATRVGRVRATSMLAQAFTKVQNASLYLWTPTEKWITTSRTSTSNHHDMSARLFAERYGVLFLGQRYRWRCHFVVDFVVAVLVGTVLGAAASVTENTCAAVVWSGAILTTISVLQFVFFVAARPASMRIDNIVNAIIAALTASSVATAAFVEDDGLSSGILTTISASVQIVWMILALLYDVMHYDSRHNAFERSLLTVLLQERAEVAQNSREQHARTAVSGVVRAPVLAMTDALQPRPILGGIIRIQQAQQQLQRLISMICARTSRTSDGTT